VGQIQLPQLPPSLILTSVDRLVASNADGGISPAASHIILLGENAGRNLGALSFIVVIGAFSLQGGLANVAQSGTVVLGDNNFSAFTGTNTQAQLEGPNIVIGNDIAPLIIGAASSDVLIGGRIAHDAPALQSSFDASVVIGYEAIERQRTAQAGGGSLARRAVILGFRALRGAAFTVDGAGTGINEAIFIGAESGENAGVDTAFPGGSIEGVIAIGTRALQNINSTLGTSSNNTIAIGLECATGSRSSQRCVWIGSSITAPTLDAADDVVIGAAASGAHANNNGQNVLIGARGSLSGLGSRCIFLGSGANFLTDIGAGDDHLLVETVNSTTNVRRNLIYGNMGSLTGPTVTACGIVFGLSGAGTRDLPGMNIVKIINGSASGVAPVGGGFFYSGAGGNLHWVNTANNDFALTPASSIGNFLVAALPAAPAQGTRAYATNALAPAFGAIVAGGGAVYIPVFFNGANWIVG
jgi:hypothetical protein